MRAACLGDALTIANVSSASACRGTLFRGRSASLYAGMLRRGVQQLSPALRAAAGAAPRGGPAALNSSTCRAFASGVDDERRAAPDAAGSRRGSSPAFGDSKVALPPRAGLVEEAATLQWGATDRFCARSARRLHVGLPP